MEQYLKKVRPYLGNMILDLGTILQQLVNGKLN